MPTIKINVKKQNNTISKGKNAKRGKLKNLELEIIWEKEKLSTLFGQVTKSNTFLLAGKTVYISIRSFHRTI